MVDHTENERWTAIGGECPTAFYLFNGPTYSFDRRTGNLRVLMCDEDQVNESLIMFFGSGETSSGLVAGTRNSAGPVYSLPLHSGDNLSITQINSSGFVFIDYQNKSIILEPEKHLVFNSSRDQKTIEVNKGQFCTVEIIRNDKFPTMESSTRTRLSCRRLPVHSLDYSMTSPVYSLPFHGVQHF